HHKPGHYPDPPTQTHCPDAAVQTRAARRTLIIRYPCRCTTRPYAVRYQQFRSQVTADATNRRRRKEEQECRYERRWSKMLDSKKIGMLAQDQSSAIAIPEILAK